MPTFKIQETRELVSTAEVEASNAEHAMKIFNESRNIPPKARAQLRSTRYSDETHTIIDELKKPEITLDGKEISRAVENRNENREAK